MVFTSNNSLNEIKKGLSDDRMKNFFDLGMPLDFLDMVPAELRDKSLAELQREFVLPWGLPYPGEDVVRAFEFAQNLYENNVYRMIPLWEKDSGNFIPDLRKKGKKSVFLLMLGKDVPKPGKRKPAVIICPGGGYRNVAMLNEGIAVAKRFETEGFLPFILYYRHYPNKYPEPQKDLALAVKYVRANSEFYSVDPEQLTVSGFSAGGHLAASMTALNGEIERELMEELEEQDPNMSERYRGIPVKPNCLCLSYPVVSFEKEAHEDSFQALTGGKEELRLNLSVEKQVTEDFPETFIWVCSDDTLVPVSNSQKLAGALDKCGVRHELKIYPTGGHGCGLAEGTSAECWFDDMLIFIRK